MKYLMNNNKILIFIFPKLFKIQWISCYIVGSGDCLFSPFGAERKKLEIKDPVLSLLVTLKGPVVWGGDRTITISKFFFFSPNLIYYYYYYSVCIHNACVCNNIPLDVVGNLWKSILSTIMSSGVWTEVVGLDVLVCNCGAISPASIHFF